MTRPAIVRAFPAAPGTAERGAEEDPDAVHVEEVECIAACGGAPAMQVNYEFHERLAPASAAEIVEEYKRGDRVARTVSGSSVGDA